MADIADRRRREPRHRVPVLPRPLRARRRAGHAQRDDHARADRHRVAVRPRATTACTGCCSTSSPPTRGGRHGRRCGRRSPTSTTSWPSCAAPWAGCSPARSSASCAGPRRAAGARRPRSRPHRPRPHRHGRPLLLRHLRVRPAPAGAPRRRPRSAEIWPASGRAASLGILRNHARFLTKSRGDPQASEGP